MNAENITNTGKTAEDFTKGETVVWIRRDRPDQREKYYLGVITEMATSYCRLSVFPNQRGGSFRTPFVKYYELTKKDEVMANSAKTTRLLDFAEELAGIDYETVIDKETPGVFIEMKAEGIVAAFGMYDHLFVFEGAIESQISAFGGAVAYLNAKGLIENKCNCEDCFYFNQIKGKSVSIEARYNDSPVLGVNLWNVRFDLANVARFMIHEDGEPFSEGVIFYLNDLKDAINEKQV